jgi:AbiJ N-terminal domain 3
MISQLTRRDLVDLFNSWDPDPAATAIAQFDGRRSHSLGVIWWGRLDEIQFLKRLYDVGSMPSLDDRFDSAVGDIWQHCVNNADWDIDWVLMDPRFELTTSDPKLLAFLAETLHPEVRSDRAEIEKLLASYNRILRRDRVEILSSGKLSGRVTYSGGPAVPRPVTPEALGRAIGFAISGHVKAQNVESVCDQFHMPPNPDGAEPPFSNKAKYVTRRLQNVGLAELLSIARELQREHDHPEIEELLFEIELATERGVAGAPKNLIFGAPDSVKPDLILTDAINNEIQIVRNGEHCLVYDEPIDPDRGLSFRALVRWWATRQSTPIADGEAERLVANALFERLRAGLNEPEQAILSGYKRVLRENLDRPALVPQVYLHYDPKTVRERLAADGKKLERQRMDFLMLLPGRVRVVIELDGRQHYADSKGKAQPELYAAMVREDRRLRLNGYEVYRFGGAEFANGDGVALASQFFTELLRRYGLL